MFNIIDHNVFAQNAIQNKIWNYCQSNQNKQNFKKAILYFNFKIIQKYKIIFNDEI